MKLTVWQQFSSNHSSHYNMVGKFESEAQARAVAETLRDIVRRIRQTTATIEVIDQKEFYHPTDVEKALGEHYGFEWKYGVDWAQWRGTWKRLPVSQFRETVWFANPHSYSWQAPTEIIQLMWKLGAQEVAVGGELFYGIPSRPDTTLLVHLACQAPDEATAQLLYETFSVEFEIKLEEDRANIWSEETLTGLPFDYDIERFEYKNPAIRHFEIERDALLLKLTGLHMSFAELPQSLEMVVGYFEERNCTQMTYQFVEEEYVLSKVD